MGLESSSFLPLNVPAVDAKWFMKPSVTAASGVSSAGASLALARSCPAHAAQDLPTARVWPRLRLAQPQGPAQRLLQPVPGRRRRGGQSSLHPHKRLQLRVQRILERLIL